MYMLLSSQRLLFNIGSQSVALLTVKLVGAPGKLNTGSYLILHPMRVVILIRLDQFNLPRIRGIFLTFIYSNKTLRL